MLPNLGFHELLIFGAIAIVLFGKRLPEVARSLGSTYRQFREGLADFQRQMDVSSVGNSTRWTPPPRASEDRQAPTAPKFEPPRFEPPQLTGASTSADAAGDSSAPAPAGSGEPVS
jgi:sec-independent protein translocase protein TatA